MLLDIVIDKPLYRNICINELGLKFKKISRKEKKNIINKIDELDFFNTEKMEKNKKLYDYKFESLEDVQLLSKMNNEELQIMGSYFFLKENNYKFVSRNDFIKKLNSILRIEFDESILSEYIYKDQYIMFISQLLNLEQLIKNCEKADFIKGINYEYILNKSIFSDVNKEDFIKDIIFYLIVEHQRECEVSYSFLKDIKKFATLISKNDLKDFIYSLNILYQKNISNRNELINYTSLIERILNEKEDDNSKSLVLKGGIIFREMLKNKSFSSNERLKKMLNFSYNIRSCVVHGNDKKIIEDYDKFLKYTKLKIPEPFLENDYKNKIDGAIFVANLILLLLLRVIFKYWIKYPERINYMKIC